MGFSIFQLANFPGWPWNYHSYEFGAAIESVYNDDENLVASFKDAIGASSYFYHHSPDPIVPDVAFFYQPEGIVIAIRGTTSLLQFWEQILYVTKQNSHFDNGTISSFFLWAFAQLEQALQDKIEFIGPGRRIVVTGHSLGGAVAMLAGIRLAQVFGKDNVMTITFGQPRVGEWPLPGPDMGDYFRLVTPKDPVPWIPPGSVSVTRLNTALGLSEVTEDNWAHYGRQFEVDRDDGIFENSWPGEISFLASIADIFVPLPTAKVRWIKRLLKGLKGAGVDPLAHPIKHYVDTIEYYLARLGYLGTHPKSFYNVLDWRFRNLVGIPHPTAQPIPDLHRFIPPLGHTGGNWDGINHLDPGELAGEERVLLEFTQHTLFGGSEMAEFRGRDRRLLLKLEQIMEAISERDAIALAPQPSSKISTRTLMLDGADPDIAAAKTTLLTRVNAALAL